MSEYWKSPEGIRRRTEMLGEDFTFNTVNALQAYGRVNEVAGWRWIGSVDERQCGFCYDQTGRFYRQGMFLPRLPAHAGCRCEWELVPIDYEEPIEINYPTYIIDPNIGAKKEVTKILNQTLQKLPKNQIKNIKEINIHAKLGSFKWNNHTNEIAGQYRIKDTAIDVHVTILRDEERTQRYLYHEIGHHVYYTVLEEKKDLWNSFWKENRETMPTDYAYSNSSEGFAECYQCFQSGLLTKNEEIIIDWFKQNVGKKGAD